MRKVGGTLRETRDQSRPTLAIEARGLLTLIVLARTRGEAAYEEPDRQWETSKRKPAQRRTARR